MAATPLGRRGIEVDDIQGIIVGGYSALAAARFVLLAINDAAAARSWIGRLADEIRKAADGIPAAGARCTNIAFTYSGFCKLGLPAQGLNGFSREFREGIWDNPRRRRILGDHGKSAPETWAWGGPKNAEIDVLLLLYARDKPSLDELYSEHRQRCADGGVTEISRLDSTQLPEHKEHFGFRDGISQPKLAGLTRSSDAKHIVAPGEFLLGYPNEYGQFTIRPLIDPIEDKSGGLPQDSSGSDQRDFGRNGSYLVFRQLAQDVRGFWRFVDDATRNRDGTPNADARLKLAAQMIGRWPSGAPLVEAPERDNPKLERANAFGYHATDSAGVKCPIGAHIRRTNPRDSLPPNPGTKHSLAINKRHRILRRGRAYGEPLAQPLDPEKLLATDEPAGDRGIFFLCFNGNLGRQFEFIQNTWVNSPHFAGLYNDSDPLIGDRRHGSDGFTVQGTPVRQSIKGLPRFVDVRGGAYFFMPGIRALRFLSREPKELGSAYAAPALPASGGPPPLVLRVLQMVNRGIVAGIRLFRRPIFVPLRNAFDGLFRRTILAVTQTLINLGREDEHLGVAEERELPIEADVVREITQQMTQFLYKHYRDGIAERAGNTKTYGLVRASFEVSSDLREDLYVGVFRPGQRYAAYVRFGGPGPLAPPDLDDNGVLSIGVKLMGVDGDKLIDDEKFTQDFTGISAPTFTTPNIYENLKLQQYVYQDIGALYFLNPLDSHYLDAVMQGLYAKTYASPLEVPYWSCVPFLFGPGRAIKYAFVPLLRQETRVPWRPSTNYLREAMVKTLGKQEVCFDFTVQFQTHPRAMPIENASVIWPERLSPYVTIARLRIPPQRFDSTEQLAFARHLSFNPWHCVAEHRPLGNQNRARRHIYLETSRVRQRINAEPRIEPTGEERFES